MPIKTTTLWIGGSSGLARTSMNNHEHADFILTGVEASAPSWTSAPYCCIDLTGPVRGCLQRHGCHNVETMIISVRALLVTGNGNNEAMLGGLQVLLEEAMQLPKLKNIIHISSVAAVNHLQTQLNINEPHTLPPIADYEGSYDVFKRTSEDIITACSEQHLKTYCHLRISAIFSDTPDCIQCSALACQSYIGAYIPTNIDCNSAKNVAAAIRICSTCQGTSGKPPCQLTFCSKYRPESIPSTTPCFEGTFQTF
jgi:hypothetical protein